MNNQNEGGISGVIALGIVLLVVFNQILIALIPIIIMVAITGIIVLTVIGVSLADNQNSTNRKPKMETGATYTEGNQLITYYDGREVWTDKREVEL